jgi:Zn-dependent protease
MRFFGSGGGRRVLFSVAVLGVAVIVSAVTSMAADRDAFDESLTAALEASNPEAALLFERANAARDEQAWKRAEALYVEVRQLVPDFFHATRRQCGVVMLQGRRDEALVLCRQALEAAETPENLTAMARVMVEAGTDSEPTAEEVTAGLELAWKAFRLAPADPVVLPSICVAAAAGNDLELLRAAVDGLTASAPEEMATHYFAFLLAATEGRIDDATNALERARELGLAEEAYQQLLGGLRGARSSRAAAVEFSGPFGKLIEGLAWYLIFLLSVTFHEAAHAFSAQRGGDPTAYRGGQVSLSPLPHIRREPFGMVVLPVISLFLAGWPFGFASTPYDPHWADRHPRRAAWMSLAGPGANLALLLLAAALIRLGVLFGVFVTPTSVNLTSVAVAPGAGAGAAYVLSLLFSLNLILVVLNLIPLPPLDGSGALPLLFGEASAGRFRRVFANPMFSWVGLIIAWKLFGPLFHHVFLAAVNLLSPGSQFG